MEILVTSKNNCSYNIVSADSFTGLKDRFAELFPQAKQLCIISDKNVFPLYGNDLKDELGSIEGISVYEYIVEAGEKSKSLDNVIEIEKFLLSNDFSRNDVLVSLGGGVISDLTGFAASLYKRGIPAVYVPTTVLSIVDASIGGKTGVDFENIKNVIGAFKMPSLIYICNETLKTLPEREFYSGFGEIMKAALLGDAKFYEWLIENMYEIFEKNPDTITEMFERSISIKKTIVEKDPFEKGERALLNLGHTFGHAIEIYYKGELLHGECVALGCVAAAFISWKMDYIPMEEYYEIRDMFVPFNLPISIDNCDPEKILEILYKDKKNDKDSVNMVLLKRIGKAFVCNDIKKDMLLMALEELNFKEED